MCSSPLLVLTDTFTAMSNLKDRRVHVKELDQTMISVGIHLLPDELQQLQNSVTIAGEITSSYTRIQMFLITHFVGVLAGRPWFNMISSFNHDIGLEDTLLLFSIILK